MSHWPGKYVIGLTGNIATGKSVVRRMLEHLGAYSIDADTLAHRAISKGAPGYGPVLDTFGKFVLDGEGEIDRGKLGRLVFGDAEALRTLEEIIHPLVELAVDILVRRANQKVVVIEAIKLLEGNLLHACDSIWVTYAPEDIQVTRLVQRRGMSEPEARMRIQSQASQEIKKAAANVIIHNTGTYEETWDQVVAAWKQIGQSAEAWEVFKKKTSPGKFGVQRGHPKEAANIASLINRLSGGIESPTEADILVDFGEVAFLLLSRDEQLVGLAGWQVENLVARTKQLYLDPGIPASQGLEVLVNEIERASHDLQCEASLIFLPGGMPYLEQTWNDLGYACRLADDLGVQAWREAASESQPRGTILLFKQLRQDRVLRPI